MRSVAFVTYNTVGDSLSSGWHESDGRRALVVQNTKGDRWCAEQGALSPTKYASESDRVRGEIGSLWSQIQSSIPELDHLVVYVGSSGSERAITLAAQLASSKVTFVLCDCGLGSKRALIQRAGLTEAREVLGECGGHRTMGALYRRFMTTGELMPYAG